VAAHTDRLGIFGGRRRAVTAEFPVRQRRRVYW
jgi:hypothetical protein